MVGSSSYFEVWVHELISHAPHHRLEIESTRTFSPDTEIKLAIAIPDLQNKQNRPHICVAKAKVKYQVLKSDSVNLGVEIVQIDDAGQSYLDGWIQRLAA